MIKIESISGAERGSFAVNSELEYPTVLVMKVMEHSASWPEYQILELPIGKSEFIVKGFNVDSIDKLSFQTFKYNPEDSMVMKAQTSSRGGYLVTESDGTKHLPTKENGQINKRLCGAAHAALTVGYRGNTYNGPNKEKALAKLKRIYKREGMKWPTESK